MRPHEQPADSDRADLSVVDRDGRPAGPDPTDGRRPRSDCAGDHQSAEVAATGGRDDDDADNSEDGAELCVVSLDFFAPPRSGARMGHDLRKAVSALHHRGPDAGGVWTSEGVGLGHRRLSILDLSPLGHQPMRSHERPLTYGVQRRGLQLPARCAPSSRPLGRRFRAAATPRWCSRPSSSGASRPPSALHRHVRHRGLGRARAAAAADSRPPGREAAVLRLGRQGASGSARSSRRCARSARGSPRSTATRWATTSTTATSTRRARSTGTSPSCCRATGSSWARAASPSIRRYWSVLDSVHDRLQGTRRSSSPSSSKR